MAHAAAEGSGVAASQTLAAALAASRALALELSDAVAFAAGTADDPEALASAFAQVGKRGMGA